MKDDFEYVEPIDVKDMADCFFYHCMSLPESGEVGTQWDLRDTINEYLGNFNFSGKRVLDMGAASGFLTFEMEKRGADVVSFDMNDGAQWNIVPQYNSQRSLENALKERSLKHQKLKNAYWFIHREIQSNAKVYYGDIYNLPDALGQFDVAIFGMILSHLRDPFQALYSASRLVKNTIIVTNQTLKTEEPIAYFMPSRENMKPVWWFFSDGCIKRMLGVLGFEVKYTVISNPRCLKKDKDQEGHQLCTAFVAQRRSSPF